MSFWLLIAFFLKSFLPYSVLAADSKASPEDIFLRGNLYYKEGRFKEAISEYTKLVSEGFKNGVLFYNLGNAYFRDGQIAKAILYYERAKRYMPRNEDLQYNLEHVNQLTIDKLKSNQPGRFRRWFLWYHYYLNPDEHTLLASSIFVVLCLLTMGLIFAKRSTLKKVFGYLLGISVTCFLCVLISLGTKIGEIERSAFGIIMVSKVEAKSGPSEDFETLFFIHKGAKVKVLQSKDNWCKIKLPTGFVGWIRLSTIERI
jgi:hypothetical protein